jgi:hypothetical protein
MATTILLNGRVHGQTIEFDEPLPCNDGQRVRVMLLPDQSAIQGGAIHPSEGSPPSERLPPGEGLRRAFGAWAGDGEELDRFVEETYAARKLDRPEIEP